MDLTDHADDFDNVDVKTKVKLANSLVQTQTFIFQTITKHPDYTKRLNDDDIALIELEREVSFEFNIFPACINEDESVGIELIMSGFGVENFKNGKLGDIFKYLKFLAIFSKAKNQHG